MSPEEARGDVLTVEELCQRLRTSERMLERLARDEGFPLRRGTPQGARWSEVVAWLTTRRLRPW